MDVGAHQPARPASEASPRDERRQTLERLVAEVLALDAVGAEDDFFELGGSSVDATRILARVEATFGVRVSLPRFFAAPTVAGLDELVAEAATAPSAVGPEAGTSSSGRRLPVSFGQQRLWFLHQLDPSSTAYAIAIGFRLLGRLEIEALERALNEVVARHDALRTTLVSVDGQPFQSVAPSSAVGLEPLLVADEEEALLRARAQAHEPWDLERGPLVRTRLLRIAPDDHLLVATFHHAVADGWSLEVFLRELLALYEAFAHGRPSPLDPLGHQYADAVVWQRERLRGEELERQRAFWLDRLDPPPEELDLPTDRPRPAMQTGTGGWRERRLPQRLTSELEALARRSGGTLFMALLAGFDVLLARYGGGDDVAVGVPVANRPRPEFEPLIGFFANTLVLRTSLDGDPSFEELLARVRETTVLAVEHEQLPFEQLVEELRPERDLSRQPLVQALFAYQSRAPAAAEVHGLEVVPREIETGGAAFDVVLSATPDAEGVRLGLTYNADLFDAATVDRMLEHYETLLDAAVARPHVPVSRLPLVPEAERRRLLVEWNATERPLPAGALVHELVEEQAGRAPAAPAVRFQGRSLTYAELDAAADVLAERLAGLGIGRGSLVGVGLDRGLELVVAWLGILKAGAAYLPLDPSYPTERLAFMLEDARVSLLLTGATLVDGLPTARQATLTLDVDELLAAAADPEAAASRPRPAPDELAYVIYTSGSTGRPKAVGVPHRGLVNVARAQQALFRNGPGDRVLQFSSPSFDASVFEFVMALASGAELCLASREALLPGTPLVETMRAEGVTIATVPPSSLAEVPPAELPALRTLTVAGEACTPELVEAWAPGRRFFNLYGPTETTIWASACECRAGERRRPTIGGAIDNTRLYVLDERLELLPTGVPGELCIGGVGVARGYLRRPDLTAASFVPDPFGSEGARLYRTGDRARRLADGTLEFLGRLDEQVKVRGFRIEPGEIETALAAHPEVRECAVDVRADGAGARLVAYVVPLDGAAPSVPELRAFLRRTLPEHMLPSAFCALPALPLGPNGKLDRKALPEPDGGLAGARDAVAPRNPTEERIAEIFAEILGLERVGVEDSFFEFGGHSLTATRVASRVSRAFSVQLPVRAVFESSTVAELAEVVKELLIEQLAELPDDAAELLLEAARR